MKTNLQRLKEATSEIRRLENIINITSEKLLKQELLPASESQRINILKAEMIELIDEMYESELSYALNLRNRLSEFKLKLLTFY